MWRVGLFDSFDDSFDWGGGGCGMGMMGCFEGLTFCQS